MKERMRHILCCIGTVGLMMTMGAVPAMADTLDDAKLKVGTYSKDVLMDDSIKELFICDNKVILGFIYSKIKLANLKLPASLFCTALRI